MKLSVNYSRVASRLQSERHTTTYNCQPSRNWASKAGFPGTTGISKINCRNLQEHGVRYRGARGPWPPPPRFHSGGGSNAFGPLDFRKNSVMYTINVQCFSLKKQWNAYIIVYILLKFSQTSKFFLTNFQNCQ